jgi:Nitroreductase
MKARARRGTLSVIANRRSIRFFSDTPVPDEVVDVLIDAGQRAPCVYQSYTVIRISDQSLRSRIREMRRTIRLFPHRSGSSSASTSGGPRGS